MNATLPAGASTSSDGSTTGDGTSGGSADQSATAAGPADQSADQGADQGMDQGADQGAGQTSTGTGQADNSADQGASKGDLVTSHALVRHQDPAGLYIFGWQGEGTREGSAGFGEAGESRSRNQQRESLLYSTDVH